MMNHEPAPRSSTRSVRGRFPRKRTIQLKHITQHELAVGWLDAGVRADEAQEPKPRTREECKDGYRPCPYVSCKHHMFLDVNPNTGAITLNWPLMEPDQMSESCSLDLADRGGMTLEEIGFVMNLTRERVRQIEVRALASKLRAPAVEFGLDEAIADMDADRRSPLAAAEDLEPDVAPSEV